MGRFSKWMIAVVLFPMVLTAIGCGGAIYETGEFEKYMVSFRAESARFGVVPLAKNIRIEFATLEQWEFGRCTQDPSFAYVRIDSMKWQRLDEDSREALLFHELGHCLLGREHMDTWIRRENRPLSVMHAVLIDGSVYRHYREDLVQELFKSPADLAAIKHVGGI